MIIDSRKISKLPEAESLDGFRALCEDPDGRYWRAELGSLKDHLAFFREVNAIFEERFNV